MLSSLARSSLRYRILSRCLVASRLCSSLVEIPEAPVVHPLLTKRAEAMKIRFNELEKKISQGCFDQEISKEFSNLSVILDNYHKYQLEMENFSNLKEMVGQDPELSDEARDEMYEILPKVVKTANILKSRLLPQILHSDKPTIIELRPGIGGSEAGIFSNDLLEMYQNFANHMRWKWTLISKSVSNNGFLNEAILAINSPNSYDCLRHESGVHRVQRIPSTETKGRIHTSTAAVVVLPKVSEGNESSLKEDERIFKPGEIRIDTMRAGGKGGQHVNTTDSAVRITHLPTGIHVVQQDERSQPKNKAKAFSILRARLAALEREKQIQEQKKIRTEQVTTTDRSDKIRTYNYPQNRVTDHRCGFSLYDIESCMDGSKLMDIIDAVQQHELEERLQDLIDGEA
ncbi:uncharacterized protein PRCAT00000501001 [Priceomyces carsonii]|uniref:uncharacterized protein n=1 Tax=Priceomyces carsonii TaxID=28549 RepID=UPI002ED9F562|nr:unnamed protein product [Priceomyces carsonii]